MTSTKVKINDLTADTALVSGDEFIFQETGGGTTKKINFSNLKTAIESGLSVTTSQITADSDLDLGAFNLIATEATADEFIGDLRGAIIFKAQAGEALSIGEVVYISGISGNTTVVSKADADDAAKMPAFGIAASAASLNNPVDIYTFGTLGNLDTDTPGWSIGDELFVSTTAGALQNTPPTGESALIQKIAKVTRVNLSAGSIKITGAGRANATPNLNSGNIFIGNGSNQAVSSSLATEIESNITEASVTQHQAALSITESQISDLNHAVDVVSNVATDTILGRTTAGSGDSEELTPTSVRTLINVQDGAEANPDLISQAEAEAGTATTERLWTAERVAQAIEALAVGGLEIDPVAKTASFTAVKDKQYLVDTSAGAFTITLPLSPAVGDTFGIIDLAGTFGSNFITLDRNGSNVLRAAEDGIIDINNWSTPWVYSDATNGWLPVSAAAIESAGSSNLFTVEATVRSAAFTAVAGKFYKLDCTGGVFSVTLPATPTEGDEVFFRFVNGSDPSVNNVTFLRNGSEIEDAASDYVWDVASPKSFSLLYLSDDGWITRL